MPGIPMSTDRARPDFDPTRLFELIGDDREFLVELVALFEEDAARLTVELGRAIARADPAASERVAHSLKGVLSHFGESDALNLARRLEWMGMRGDLGGADGLARDLAAEVDVIRRGLARLVS